MKIVYTYHCLQQRIGGISRYFFEIFKRLSGKNETQMVSKYLNNLYFSEIIKDRKLDLFGERKFLTKYYIRILIEELFLFFQMRNNTADVIHHTGEFPWVFLYTKHTPIVITVHDMIPELVDNDRLRCWYRKKSIKKADAIICVSEKTKQDLLRVYPDVNKDKIFVVYHGFENQFSKTYEDNTSTLNFEREFILFVGARDGYKNFDKTIRSLASLLKMRHLHFVCTGKSFSEKETALINEFGLGKLVVNLGYVSEPQLIRLYKNASLFIFPSKYEGFGIPILESWANDCPLCLSNASCFPEIAGDGGAYFDPDNADSILQCVTKVLDDIDFRKKIVAKGRERRNLFSWDVAARKTLEVYDWTITHYDKK